MADYNEQFTPEEINEQIRRFSSASQHTSPAGADPNRQLMQDLRRIYRDNDTEEDTRSLQQSWQRIVSAQKQSGHYVQPTFTDRKVLPMNTFTKEAGKASPRRPSGQRFGVLVAAAVALFLVGSMVVTFTLMRSHQTTQTTTTNTLTGAAGSSSTRAQASTSDSSSTAVRAKQGDTIEVFQQPGIGIYGIDWSSDGKRIVSSGSTVYSWDATTGQNSVQYYAQYASQPSNKNIGDVFGTPQWSPDSKSFALPYLSDIQIWDSTTKKLIKTLHYAFPNSNNSLIQQIRFVHWSANGKSISAIASIGDSFNSATNMLVTFDLATGAKQSEVKLAAAGLWNRVAWSPDGNYLAAAYAEQPLVNVVNLRTGQTAYTYNSPDIATDLAWSPDSKRVASGIGNGKDETQAWDALTGNHVVTHQGGTLPVWSPNGKYIATGRIDPTGKVHNDTILVWDATTGKTIYVYKGDQGNVYALAWSPNSKYIAAGEGGGNGKTSDVRVWAAFA